MYSCNVLDEQYAGGHGGAWLCAGAGQPEVWKHGPVLASGRPRWKRLFLDLWAAGPLYAQNPRFLFS